MTGLEASHPLAGCRRLIGVGFRRWKAANLKPMFAPLPQGVVFVPNAAAAARLEPEPQDALTFWGSNPPPGVAELARQSGAKLLRMEDGFLRSVGLGSDLIPPYSLVLDARGIYFDATRPSELEVLCNTAVFTDEELAQARAAREFIVTHELSKYNVEPRQAAPWRERAAGRQVVFVPGQVEDDASIACGCSQVKTNFGLLQAVRATRPEAFIVYKEHPDVTSRNRTGRVAGQQARALADHVETSLSAVSCISACDEVHTMTSLTGFDALLRGKTVVTYGMPFYAGWGLTQDMHDVPGEGGSDSAKARRQRRLTLDELTAAALLRYPVYWDWDARRYTSCDVVLRQLLARRNALEAAGELQRLHTGWLRRQFRKLAVLVRNARGG